MKGHLRPGAKQRIAETPKSWCQRHADARALSRLVSRGLVIAIGQLGLSRGLVSSEDLADIIPDQGRSRDNRASPVDTPSGDGKWEGGDRLRHCIRSSGSRGQPKF